MWKSIKNNMGGREENTAEIREHTSRYIHAQKGPKPQTNKVNKQTPCAAQCGSDHDRNPTVKHGTTKPCVSKKARAKLRVSEYKDILRYSLLSPEEQPNLEKNNVSKMVTITETPALRYLETLE